MPDREKEYQYSSELPPLEIPPDLTGSSSKNPMDSVPDASGTASLNEYQQEKSDEPVALTADTIRLIASPGVPVSLEIEESYPRVWRIVGKALSRLEFEVTDRNRSTGVYYFLYNETETVAQVDAAEDSENDDDEESGGLFGDLGEVFSDDTQPKETEFRVKLEEQGDMTRLTVLDKNDKPQSEGTGLRIVKMIRDKILSFQP